MEHDVNLEELFDQATEDISTYLWALDARGEPPEGYSPGYLLLLALGSRARSGLALDRMRRVSMSDEFVRYQKRLQSLYSKAEENLKAILHQQHDTIIGIVNSELVSRLDDLAKALESICRMAQIDLYADDSQSEPWSEVRDAAHDFLLRFHDISLAKEQLAKLGIQEDKVPNFWSRFHEVESSFRFGFVYFSAIEDLLPRIRNREYGSDVWWLTTSPQREMEARVGLPDTVIRRLGTVFQRARGVTSARCPGLESVFAVALHEAGPDEERVVREHLLHCRNCLDLYLDARIAAVEAAEQVAPPVLYPALEEEISRRLPAQVTPEDLAAAIAAWMLSRVITLTMRGRAIRWHGPGEGEDEANYVEYTGPNFFELELAPERGGELAMPIVPGGEDYKGLRDFLDRVQVYHSSGSAILADGSIEQLELESHRGRLRHIQDKGYAHIWIFVGTDREEVKKAARVLHTWLKKKRKDSSLAPKPPGNAILLSYRVARG